MNRRWVGLLVTLVILAGAATGWTQANPTNLTVIRKSNNRIWTRTCNGNSSCSEWVQIGGLFSVQPTLTWDPSIQKYILVGIGNDKTSIWKTTFDANGIWDGAWINITGTSGGSPSPVGIAGGPVQPQTMTVTCPGQSLQAAIDGAQTGATINVTGICNQNVIIREEKARLTLDGGNVATLNGNSESPTVTIIAKGVTVQNFQLITGGGVGVAVYRGGTASIRNNGINSAGTQGNAGIVVAGSSVAIIQNNDILNSPGCGIIIDQNSSARIGFESPADSQASPNTIQGNGSAGIAVTRTSNARIVGNTIASNMGDGISVLRGSQADIADNTINGNGANGISAYFNSGIQLGEDNPTTFLHDPNVTTVNNGEYGIVCSMGGYVNGHLGSGNQINGTWGQTSIATNCPNNLVSP
jgi:parallel beta-helix repeat protein